MNDRLRAALLAVVALPGPPVHPAPPPPLVLRGGRVVDGTGAAARAADVRIRGDRIAEVEAGLVVTPEDRVVDVTGLTVAPGFIDMHSHVDRQVFALPAASQTAQGITTSVVGVDGAGLRRISQESYADRPTWSPAPYNEIAYAARTGPGNDVKVLDLATGQVTQLTFGEGTNESPSFSPNGRHIAFMSTRAGRHHIFTMARDGRNVRQVTRLGNNYQPDWSRR